MYFAAGVALRHVPLLDVVAVSVGLTWGFLFSLSAAVNIHNGRDSVYRPTMIPVLLLIPLAATISVLPFWFFAKRRNSKRVQDVAMTAPNCHWPRFTLRTLFVVVTMLACWMGYYIHWIHGREAGREWLDAHRADYIACGMRLEVAIPWPLRLLGEVRSRHAMCATSRWRTQKLSEFEQQVAEMKALFPESHIVAFGLRRESEATDLPPSATH